MHRKRAAAQSFQQPAQKTWVGLSELLPSQKKDSGLLPALTMHEKSFSEIFFMILASDMQTAVG